MIMMPHGWCRSSPQLTGYADFWHPTGVLNAAYQAHPERFVRKPPAPPAIPAAAWINPPEQKEAAAQ
jgi:hypothetical protein